MGKCSDSGGQRADEAWVLEALRPQRAIRLTGSPSAGDGCRAGADPRGERDGDQCESHSEKLYLTSPPCLIFSLSTFLALHPSFCPGLSFSFPGIEEGTCTFEVADSRTGLADVLA